MTVPDSERRPQTSQHLAAIMWATAPFTGGISALIMLAVSWSDRESLLWRHALVATGLYVALMALFLPVWVVGWFYGAFTRGGPSAATLWTTIVLAAVGMVSSLVGVVMALRGRPAVDRSGRTSDPR